GGAGGTGVRYVKPNDGLPSREGLEIYNRQYWFRVIDSMYDDFPGLCAVLGQRAFDRLARAYLADCPSRSFTLRDLGSRLEQWLRKNRRFAGDKAAVALDMAALGWAHIEAWDSAELQVLGPEHLAESGPRLRVTFQPQFRLLARNYRVDDVRIRVNAVQEEHEPASNAPTKPRVRRTVATGRLKPERIYLAVHRMENSVYYRRLDPTEFRLLEALRQHERIGKALTGGFKNRKVDNAKLERWFSIWAELGWLCSV